jgi:hypothetical protein
VWCNALVVPEQILSENAIQGRVQADPECSETLSRSHAAFAAQYRGMD